ncbi:MAG: hypothetical protein WBE34_14630, partial [Candidatus Nitrosopolaris sp.]
KKITDLMKCNSESLAVNLREHIQSSPTVRDNVIFTFLLLFTRTLRISSRDNDRPSSFLDESF